MYFCSVIFVNIFGGGELTFLSTSKAGCCRFLCKRLGKPKASTFICPLLVTLISILFSSGLELNLGGKEEPLLAAASALRARGTGWCFLGGKMAQWEAARSISHPFAAPRQRAQLPAHLCCTYDVFCASEVICPCPWWQKAQKFQLTKWGSQLQPLHCFHFSDCGFKCCRGFPSDKIIKQMLSWCTFIRLFHPQIMLLSRELWVPKQGHTPGQKAV